MSSDFQLLRRNLQCLAFALLALAAMCPCRSLAQEAHGDYQGSVNAGLKAFDGKQYAEAREHFSRAHALEPSARTLRALALTDFALDDLSLARRELEEALASRVKPLLPSQGKELTDLLNWMHDHLGAARLEITPAHAHASVDSKAVTTTELLLTAGEHTLLVSAPGYVSEQRTFDVRPASAPLALRVTLRASPAEAALPAAHGGEIRPEAAAQLATAPSTSRRPQPSDAWRTASMAALVVGGVSILGAGVSAAAALAVCPDPACASEERSGTYGALRTVSSATFYGGVGLAALGAAGLIWLEQTHGTSDSLVIRPAAGAVMLGGRF